MDDHPIVNPFDEDEKPGGQPMAWIILGVAALECGILFAAAFFFFQPDAKSLVDKYFPSPTANLYKDAHTDIHRHPHPNAHTNTNA